MVWYTLSWEFGLESSPFSNFHRPAYASQGFIGTVPTWIVEQTRQSRLSSSFTREMLIEFTTTLSRLQNHELPFYWRHQKRRNEQQTEIWHQSNSKDSPTSLHSGPHPHRLTHISEAAALIDATCGIESLSSIVGTVCHAYAQAYDAKDMTS